MGQRYCRAREAINRENIEVVYFVSKPFNLPTSFVVFSLSKFLIPTCGLKGQTTKNG